MPLLHRLVAVASQRAPRLSRHVLASSGYTLDVASMGEFTTWGAAAAGRQDRAWRPIVAAAKAGSPREDVVALFQALSELPPSTSTLLEVGCGGGYNSELVLHSLPGLAYTGVDISDSMIELAREHYPTTDFRVASAYSLPFGDGEFEVVMDGVALIHMPDWRQALSEYARVAGTTVILHGLTLTDAAPSTEFAKYAYGQPSREVIFNRAEMTEAVEAVGLRLERAHPGDDYNLAAFLGIPSVSETWVLGVTSR